MSRNVRATSAHESLPPSTTPSKLGREMTVPTPPIAARADTSTSRPVLARLVRVLACACCAACIVPAISLAAGDANVSGPCPNEQLVGFTVALPDCRGLEQVTPTYTETDKLRPVAIAEDGTRVVIGSLGAFAGDEAAPVLRTSVGVVYAITRGAAGWETLPISPLSPTFRGAVTWRVLSADLSSLMFDMPSAPAGQEDFYLREPAGAYSHIGPITPPEDGAVNNPGPDVGVPTADYMFLGGSPDLSHVVFDVKQPYGWSGDLTAPSTFNMYEYVGANNAEPVMVAVRGGAGSKELIGRCGASLGGPPVTSSYNAISADGSKIFFTPLTRANVADTSCEGEPGPSFALLYARIDQAETVPLSLPECSSGCAAGPSSDSTFAGASRDGRRAFFLSTQKLTPQAAEDATPHDSADLQVANPAWGIESKTGCPEAIGSGCNLYEYDFSRPVGKHLAAVSAGSSEPHVQGVVRISQDGSHVYFVATGQLTSEANANHETAEPGANNLYVYEPAAGAGRTRFIAKLAPTVEAGGEKTSLDEELWGRAGNVDERPADATPDGRYLVFQSHADLTSDDTSKGVWQVFEYEAEGGPHGEGLLRRVSVGREGYNGNGNTEEYDATLGSQPVQYLAAYGSGGTAPTPQWSALSADGGTVFFQSGDLLAPGGGVSSSSGLAKVYEWHAGHVYRIAGGGAEPAELLGTDSSGQDAFFETREPQLPGAPTEEGTIYDARVGGGTAPASAVSCSREACLGPVPGPPSLPTPGPGTALAGENFAAPTAPKPQSAASRRAKALAAALKACRRDRSRPRRLRCEAAARRRYGASARRASASPGRRQRR